MPWTLLSNADLPWNVLLLRANGKSLRWKSIDAWPFSIS